MNKINKITIHPIILTHSVVLILVSELMYDPFRLPQELLEILAPMVLYANS